MPISKQASESVAAYSTLVNTPLLPAGITVPENEKPKIVEPPVDTVNPESAAKPPEAAPNVVPSISN